jgi:hypothetical protein
MVPDGELFYDKDGEYIGTGDYDMVSDGDID